MLKTLDPVSENHELLEIAKASGEDPMLNSKVDNFIQSKTTKNQVYFTWDNGHYDEYECNGGTFLQLKKDGEVLNTKIVESPGEFDGLEPCTNYMASVNVFLGHKDGQPIFIGNNSYPQNFWTTCSSSSSLLKPSNSPIGLTLASSMYFFSLMISLNDK